MLFRLELDLLCERAQGLFKLVGRRLISSTTHCCVFSLQSSFCRDQALPSYVGFLPVSLDPVLLMVRMNMVHGDVVFGWWEG